MAEANAAQPAPRNIQKLFGFVFAGLNIVVLGVGSYLVYASTLGVKSSVTTEAEAKIAVEKFQESLRGDPVVYTMEPINTNLDGVPRRLIRVEVNLEMLDQEGFEEIINKSPEAKDAITRILNNQTFNDVESVQGKLHLKNKIMSDLNTFMEKGIVKNVYFSQFVVQ